VAAALQNLRETVRGSIVTAYDDAEVDAAAEEDAPEFWIRDSSVSAGMFTSTTDEWATPNDFFDRLDVEFGFTIDVCASFENRKCDQFYDRTDNGLAQRWAGTCWMNPPYGREISAWIRKAREASQEGATVVCLIPVRTDTAYWHDDVMRAAEIRFVRGRMNFDGDAASGHNAPFPSAVVVFVPGHVGAPVVSTMERDVFDHPEFDFANWIWGGGAS
jgi:site-specific DNA-methyltransferase (adenine-specific)